MFILVCGLGGTALATYLIHENLRFKSRERLKEASSQIGRTIQSRMESYIGLLRGGAGLFAAGQDVTRDQFARFVERLEITKRYPGLQGYGYSARVPAEKVESLVASMHAQGVTNFTVWPPEPRRAEYHTIVYLEPMDARNRAALGFDMFADERRREAMEAAAQYGNPRFSKKVRLLQQIEGLEQPGFLLYLPVYVGGQIPATPDERREKLQGFIYSPFRAGDLFGGIVPRPPAGVAFSIWDGSVPKPEALLYQSHPDFRLASQGDLLILQIPGAVWALGVSELPGFSARENDQMLWMVPFLGLLASGFLAYSSFSEGKARVRTEQTANELFEQREWLQVTIGSIGDAVISTDRHGRIQFMNRMAEHLTGWKLAESQGKPLREIFRIQDEKTGEALDNPADRVLSTGATIHLTSQTILVDRTGTERSIDDSAAPIRDRRGNLVGAVLVFRDITERRRYERRSTAQHAVTKVLAESPSLHEAAGQILTALCETLRFDFGILWVYDKEEDLARVVHIWHRPNPQLQRFEQNCRTLRFKRGEGLPGLVWKTMAPEWVTDFSQDPRFPRAADAGKAGLRTAFAFPIAIDSEAFGALEFFCRESFPADDELLDVVRGIGTQIAQFVRRKRAEDALAQSEELHRAISETAADGIVVIDEKSTILRVNHAVERIFGFAKDELEGASLKKMLPARMHAAYEEGLKRLLTTGQKEIPWTGIELPGLHKDGHEIPLEISFGMAKRGSSYLFTGLMRDMTRRKEAEKQLRETEERLALLVRRAEEYAIITTGSDGRISTWNPGAQRIFGYADDEVLGRGLDIFYPEGEKHVPARQLQRAEAEGQAQNEGWRLRKDGSRFWAAGSLVCLRAEDGTVRGFAKILRDITERKNAEEAIQKLNQELEVRVERRTAALQESKEQMEAFSYTVAHDLRAPLRAMQGFAHALVEDYATRLDSAGVDYLNRIMASAHRMDALIQDLLAYSQLSRSDLSFKAVSVEEVIRSALRGQEDYIREKKAKVHVAAQSLFVRAHAATLETAIGNLVSNAIKFSRATEVPEVRIQAFAGRATVQITVEDNGIGIAVEHQDRIFRVFERLHGQNAFPGTGIGLAIVKKGVERMNGNVGVRSEPGKGSTFWIELPKEQPPS